MSNEVVFTTGPLPKDRRPSQQFIAYCASGSPVAVVESRVVMANTNPSLMLKLTLVHMHCFVYSMVTQKKVSVTGPFPLPATLDSFDIVPRPGLIIPIPKNSPQNKIDALVSVGFSQQSNNRYTCYQGPTTTFIKSLLDSLNAFYTPSIVQSGSTSQRHGRETPMHLALGTLTATLS